MYNTPFTGINYGQTIADIYANFRITHFTHRSTPSFHSFDSAFYRQPTDSHASLTLECDIFYSAFSRFQLVNVAHSHIRHTTVTVIKHFTGPAVGRAAF